MSTDILAESGLRSGFVLAVVIAAVLLANYLGGSVAWHKVCSGGPWACPDDVGL